MLLLLSCVNIQYSNDTNQIKPKPNNKPKRKSKTLESYGSIRTSDVQEDYGNNDIDIYDRTEEGSMPTDHPPPPPPLSSAMDYQVVENNNDEFQPSWIHSDDVINEKTKDMKEKEEEEESSDDDEESSVEEDESSDDDVEGEESSEEESSIEEDESDDGYVSEHDHLIDSEPEWTSEESNSKRRKKSKKEKNKKKEALMAKRNRVPLRNCCHSFFVLIQILAVVGNASMIAVQLIPVIAWSSMVIEHKVVRFYMAFFNFIFILSEFELYNGWNNWIKRGVVYTFVGVVALDQRMSMIRYGFLNPKADETLGQSWNELWTSLLIEIVSWLMIGVGCMYFLLGLLCMKSIRNRCRVDYQRRMKEYKARRQHRYG